MTQSDEEPQAKTSQTHHLALKQALGKVWWGRRFRLPGPVIPQCYNRAVRSLPAAALALATILSAQTPSYDLIVRHGGRVTSAVSKKTDYVVVGEAPGSKADDARRLGVKTIEEAELRALTTQ